MQGLDTGRDIDAPVPAVGGAGSRLDASPHSRAERLLRGTGVPAGLLFNGTELRLVSAPRGESSGWMDFRVADMSRTAGRPLCSALRSLLSEQRLLALPRGQRLAALLEDSRKYQNEVSERLSEQVMHALYALLRGLQAAHDASAPAERCWASRSLPKAEVLARLLALNAERAAEEACAGASATDAVQTEPGAARPAAVRNDPAVTTHQPFSWTMRDGR